MRATVVVSLVVLALASALALPFDPEQRSEDFTESKTVSAVQKWLTPFFNWFTNDLPKKTPSELATDFQDAGRDAIDWAHNNSFIQGIKKVFSPIHSWIKSTGNNLKDKTLWEMYDDTKDVASRVDNRVGDWIDTKLNY